MKEEVERGGEDRRREEEEAKEGRGGEGRKKWR